MNKDCLLRIKCKYAMPVAVLEKSLPFVRGDDIPLPTERRHEGWECRVLPCPFTIGTSSFIYLLPTPSIFNRAAEDLLSQIQKNYRKPQKELEVLKAAASSLLSKHNSELRAAGDLARGAEAEARESDRLLRIAHANLQEFHVSLHKDGLLPSQSGLGAQLSSVNNTIFSFFENKPQVLTEARRVRQ